MVIVRGLVFYMQRFILVPYFRTINYLFANIYKSPVVVLFQQKVTVRTGIEFRARPDIYEDFCGGRGQSRAYSSQSNFRPVIEPTFVRRTIFALLVLSLALVISANVVVPPMDFREVLAGEHITSLTLR
jgi:hypothetical protein